MSSDQRPSLLAQFLEPVESDDSQSGNWRPFLSFHLRNRVQFSMRYEHLLWVIFRPGDELVLRFSSHSVRIQGRRLLPLAQEICALTAREVIELDERYDVEENVEPVVRAIRIGAAAEGDAALAELTSGV